jgi:hypothetical protein
MKYLKYCNWINCWVTLTLTIKTYPRDTHELLLKVELNSHKIIHTTFQALVN